MGGGGVREEGREGEEGCERGGGGDCEGGGGTVISITAVPEVSDV